MYSILRSDLSILFQEVFQNLAEFADKNALLDREKAESLTPGRW